MLINESNIEQIIETISKVHQTSVDQRLIDLTEYLVEFFQSISFEQTNIFLSLTRLLQTYEDCAALKIEFLKAQCFENLLRILNTNETNLISIFEFLLELFKHSDNVQEKFLEFNGYEKFFSLLRYIRSPSMNFLNKFIFLIIEKPIFLNDDSFTSPFDSFVILINPFLVQSLLQWLPYLINRSDQEYILLSMKKILLRSLQNKMMACSNGIIYSLLKILDPQLNSNTFDEQILKEIFSLLENLAQFSINSNEIHFICQLFIQNRSLKKSLLQLLIIAAKHQDQDIQSISAYFDLQRSNSGIVLPIVRRWPSLSSSSSTSSNHFTFHCWLRLNHDVHSYPYEGRRQIYSIYSESFGFEAFIRNSSIFVLMTDHQELVYVELNDCEDLIDGSWHSLTIVHTAQRSSLFVSTLTCHLTIYIDGLLRKEVKDFKYVLLVNDSLVSSSIGSPSQRPKESILKMKTDSFSTTIAKTIQPFKGLFSSKTKYSIARRDNQTFYSQHIMVIEPNSQDTIFGQSISLFGQFASIWILAETLDSTQVQHLHTMGADFCYKKSSSDENPLSSIIFDYLSSRSLLFYHPLACNSQICLDISNCFPQINGRLINTSCFRIHSFCQSLLNLGNCSILYPIIDQFQPIDYNHSETNPIASILSLFDILFSSSFKSFFLEQLIQHNQIEILDDYLHHLSSNFFDEQFLIALEQLIDTCRSSNLLNQFIEYILLDFHIWNQSISHVRIHHLQYIFKLIKEEKKYDREKFGVQFFLDVLRQDFNLSKDDTDEQRQLRSIIYNIIKYLIQFQIHLKDFQSLLSTISTISLTNDTITFELLNVIYSLITNNELIIDLFSEQNFIESLYSLLILNNLLIETKEMIFKLINIFLQSKRLSSQMRSLLRLETNNIGFGGIISGLAVNELNPSIVHEILNLIIASNSTHAVHHMNIVLTLCSAAAPDVRYTAIRKLMKYFISQPSTCRLYAQCSGWQETLAHFFVKTRRSSSTQILTYRSLSQDVLCELKENSNNQTNKTSFDMRNHSESLVTDKTFHKSASENLIRSKDISDSNELIITPPQSIDDSREDLLIFLKTDNSMENLSEQSSPRITTSSSMKTMLIEEDDKRQITDELRRSLGLASSGDSRFFLRPSVDIDDGGILEEMCETLILAIVMILWKGIIDSDDAAWMIRGQIFSAVRHLHREYDLYLPLDYIERKILELSMETCLNDAKSERAKPTINYENNCRELIKLVHDFLSQTNENQEKITENFVNGIIPIVDSMLIFKKTKSNPDDHWTETSLTGLHILLILLGHSNLNYSSQASIRIHSLLNFRSFIGREEAAYLLSTVNRIFLQANTCKSQTYLFPLMKIILEKSSTYLSIHGTLGEQFLTKSTYEQLCQENFLMKTNQWQLFIDEITEPYADHYRSMSIRPFEMNMKIWWNNCQDMMNIAIHKRNRQIEIEKLKFQSSIVQPWQQRHHDDHRRLCKLLERRSIDHIRMKYELKNTRKYLESECGPWFDKSNRKEQYWMLSDRENIHRMRCKLIENDHFNKHEQSSRLRDNLHIENDQHTTQETFIDEQYSSDIANEYINDDKEKILISSKCSLITCASVTTGELIITDKYFYFFNLIRSKTCEIDMKYPLVWLQDIQLRRYNLRPTALEFFLINQKAILFNFDPNLSRKTRRQIFYKFHSLKLPFMKDSLNNLERTLTSQEIFNESKLMDKWLTRDLSNFDYLMMLNTISGRTYNDLNQYPIFPWIIKDYTSQVLDLNNPESFRDFSRPIGIQNSKHIDEVKFKYESFDDPTGLIQKFHYGTHYSNAASVMHYLVRMEPFTTLHIQLQSGKFDIADRQFHSFQSSWINIMDSPNDGKELIPEFFYLPEFLSNLNRFDLGKLQSTNQYLNDVQLPPWANNSSEEFIRLHRLALESDYVSANLHKWIDLIFGYKQKGQEAIDALNVFMYCSYEDNVQSDTDDDDSVRKNAIDGMIQNFGQIPSQLLTEPHPQRQTREQVALSNENQGKSLNIFQNLTHIKAFFVDVIPADEKSANPIIFISIPKNQIRSFMQQGTPDTLTTIHSNGIIGNNGWHPYDKLSNQFFIFERDPSLILEKNRLTSFSPTLDLTSRLFALSHDGKYIFSGGHWDSSLRIYSLSKCKTIHSIIRHTDIITCLSLDSTGYILITGSRDTTCIIWYIDQDSNTFLSPERILHGHRSEISCLCISSELDLIITGSLDGTCHMYTVEKGIYIRTLHPTECHDPIKNLKLSDERYLVIQTENDQTYLFLYSINGNLIRTRKFEYEIVDMILADQYIILAVNHQSKTEQTSVAARVIIKDLFEMTTIQTIRLRTQINCLHITKDFSHLLVPVKDGKLFVLTPEKKVITKSAFVSSKNEKK